jgi:murein DD-endopeptidase MepM/ murein hydrolase activator NlpD
MYPKILTGGRMKGKFYLIIYFCALLSVSCSSLSAVDKKPPVSCGLDPQFLAGSPQRWEKPKKAPVHLASLISESCENGALAGFFNSQARLATKSNCNLPTREFKFPLNSGTLSSPFGHRGGRYHAGVDISANKGDPVVACADGIVIDAGRQKDRRGLGILVTIDHGKGIATDYGHLSQALVRPGQRVRQGDKIGLVGSTGRTTCAHLHLQVRNGNQFYDPMIFFNQSQLSGVEIAENFLRPVRERLPRFRHRVAQARN